MHPLAGEGTTCTRSREKERRAVQAKKRRGNGPLGEARSPDGFRRPRS